VGRHVNNPDPGAVCGTVAADAINDLPGRVGFCLACDVAAMPGVPVCIRCGGELVAPREALAVRRAQRDQVAA
jgi:hypothetical protein